jgi:hypothetical protein
LKYAPNEFYALIADSFSAQAQKQKVEGLEEGGREKGKGRLEGEFRQTASTVCTFQMIPQIVKNPVVSDYGTRAKTKAAGN